jgi:gamma-glutamylcysteine synthetase
MQAVAERFDCVFKSTDHQTALNLAIAQVNNPAEASLSAKVFEAYAQHHNNHLEFGQHYSQEQAKYFLKHALSNEQKMNFEQMATLSLDKQRELDTQTEPSFANYLNTYLNMY